jgi:hypothetical protein
MLSGGKRITMGNVIVRIRNQLHAPLELRWETQEGSYPEAADEVSRLSTGESFTLMGNFSGSTVAIIQIVDGLPLTTVSVLPSTPHPNHSPTGLGSRSSSKELKPNSCTPQQNRKPR